MTGKEKKNEEVQSDFEGVEVAVAQPSMLYTSADFPRYNPDDLIGRKGFGVYKKMMRDEQIKAGVKFKRDAVVSRGYYFKLSAEETGLSEDEVARRVGIFEHIISELEGDFNQVIHKVLSAIYNGFSLSEVIGKDIEFNNLTYKGLRNVKLRPFDTFEFITDEYDNVLDLRQNINGKQNSLDINKFIHFVMNPDIDEHYGESELRPCYRSWFSKDMTIKFRNIFLERFAGGFRSVKPPKDKKIRQGSPEHTSITNILNSINSMTGIVWPENGYEIETHFPNGSGSDAFSKTIKDCDMSIATALLIPPLLGVSPQGDTGSYSQSTVQLDAFFWTLINDANRLAECLNEQLFRHLGLINFGDEFYPRFTWNPGSKSKAVELARLFAELVNGRVLKNTKEDEQFLRDALELPAVSEFISEEGANNEPSESNKDSGEKDPESGGEKDRGEDDRADIESDDETIVGVKATIKNATLRKATTRVNFAMIGVASEGIVEDNVNRVSQVTDEILKQLIEDAKKGGEVGANLVDNFKETGVSSRSKQKLNARVNRFLRDGVRLGTKEAKKEIDKAKGSYFSIKINEERLSFIAEDYYKVNAFRITGNITEEMTKMVEQEILNGARYDKTWDEIETAIYKTAAAKGLLSVEEAREALGEALDVENPDARLRTIVRTSTFDAINNARDAYFTDPQLGGFVQAYEYSAILDSRTTEVCRHLEEDNAGDHTVDWYRNNPGFRPPNHFNCRSLLIAVTVDDMADFEEGPTPSVSPQEGFS